MRLAQKERLFRDQVYKRFGNTLDFENALMSALCVDASIKWRPDRAASDGNQEKTAFEFRGTRVAVKRRTINSSAGFSTRYVRLFDGEVKGGSRRFLFAEKRFGKPPDGTRGQRIWLEEAFFYFDVQPKLKASGFRIPECRYIVEQEDGSYSLCMERIASFRKVESYADRLVAARALGQLAGVAAVRKVAHSPWMRLPHEGADLSQSGTAMQLMQRLAVLNILTPEEVSGFDLTHEILAQYYAKREKFLLTIRHNDAHGGNVRINAMNEICVLDWARVSAGHIGDDLCQLFQPWIYAKANVSTLTDIRQIENALFEAYVDGVKAEIPECDMNQIRISRDVRSIVHSLSRLKSTNSAMEVFLKRLDEEGSMKLSLYYRYISDKVRALRAELCA